MTDYVVFEQTEESPLTVEQRGIYDARSAEEAIKTATTQEATTDARRFWACPERSWNGLEVRVEQVVRSTALSLLDKPQEEPKTVQAPPAPEPAAQSDMARDIEQVERVDF